MLPFIAGALAGLLILILVPAIAVAFATRRLRRRLTEAQNTARHAERLAELGTLTGGLAHEIKNPLSTIGLNLQLLGEDIDPSTPGYERLQHRLGTVLRETNRLRDILEDFLRYAGKLELDLRPVDLNPLLEEMVDFFAPQAQVQRVQLRLRPNPTPLMVRADPKILKQAILNLMLNAVQAMPEGGELILSAGQLDGKASLSVIDTGPGMTPEVLHRIFEAYYSTKKAGTGLGLAMARRIVEEHGGALSVRSEVGKGSDFTITLPLATPV
ncbi:MAG TPA: ATP-binding protein [Tepidisphaeraceae bacterium]|nr:ATP-binding protein [Tepidisphaeraceae bacterium]